MIRRGGEAALLAGLISAKNWTAVEIYQHYNIKHPGWPYNLPPPPNPAGLRAFVYAALEFESQEMANRSRLQHMQQEANKGPRSRLRT